MTEQNTTHVQNLDDLQDTMREAQKPRTLEEQVADMKRRGIDPTKNYEKWDDEDEH